MSGKKKHLRSIDKPQIQDKKKRDKPNQTIKQVECFVNHGKITNESQTFKSLSEIIT